MRKLWGGAFRGEIDGLAERFGQSIESDLRFWREDVLGSIAHARMLGATGIVSPDESRALVEGLELILEEGAKSLPRDVEDVHTAVEMRLGELVGEVAGKLHTARSRNDQVATDAKLALRAAAHDVQARVKALQRALLQLARRSQGWPMLGYTHQQPAQPITLGFHLLAHFWALQRDGWRIEGVLRVIETCPLGAAALAGTPFPIDRRATAAALGFSAPAPNALDATSDRSFVLDALHACACIALDASRMSQELVTWSGAEHGFVRLSDSVTTGSSIMPQKRNPDMAELIRGRAAGAIANWTAVAAMLKGLPLGYNRDTQDDKPPLFASLDFVRDALDLLREMYESAEWNRTRMEAAAREGHSTATALADAIAATGAPFRQAHEFVGNLVRARRMEPGDVRGALVRELGFTRQQARAVAEALDVREAIRRRESEGGTGTEAMRAQIQWASKVLRRRGFRTCV